MKPEFDVTVTLTWHKLSHDERTALVGLLAMTLGCEPEAAEKLLKQGDTVTLRTFTADSRHPRTV